MENHFQCPFCKGHLNVGNNLVFIARSKNGFSGILLIHSELGNYHVDIHPEFEIPEGENVEFKCPICSKSLTSDKSDELAHILMSGENGKVFDVYFSKIRGVKSTYRIVGDNMQFFGDDSSKYIDFFNLSQLT